MTSLELNMVFGGSRGRSAQDAWVRSAAESASNSRKRRETFQAAVDSELDSTNMWQGENGEAGGGWGGQGRVGACVHEG